MEDFSEDSFLLAEDPIDNNQGASCSTAEKTQEEEADLLKATDNDSVSQNKDKKDMAEEAATKATGSGSCCDTAVIQEEYSCEGEPSVGDDPESDTEDGDKTSSIAALELENSVKHISIQKDLSQLASFHQGNAKEMPCPLCPSNRFRSCHINKVLKHLENFHWKVSVEFGDYRMCICCLHCLRNTTHNENESPGKTSAHYHCIICSKMVSRRPEMIKHIKRHVDKGENQVKVPSGKPRIIQESNTEVQVLSNFTTPQVSGTFFNPVMKTNRQLVFCALAALSEEKKPLECLDAFSSTGIMGLQWAKHLGDSVRVTINDISDSSIDMIQENCLLNKMKVIMKGKEIAEVESTLKVEEDDYVGTIEVTQMDANVSMHMRAFDFIHLDPFGSSVNYLDAAFRNIRNMGILSVTSTDTSSLYAKTVHVTKRHYGCNIIRTEYYKELAARIVLSAVARAATRCNKGIEVLLSVALEHFVLVIVRVLRGPSLADDTAKQINSLIHCNWCEERIFQKEGNMVEENPYKQLPCDCHESMPGRSAVMLGPLWSGSLFNTGFLRRMAYSVVSFSNMNILNLLKTLISESECTTPKQYFHHQAEEGGVFIKIPSAGDVLGDPGKRKRQEVNIPSSKRLKGDVRAEHPPFYYSIHRHAIGGLNIPKLNKILQLLSEAGFQVSRTHFDPTGIRTNAPLATVKAILEKNSTFSYTSQSGSYRQTPEMQGEEEQSDLASASDVL